MHIKADNLLIDKPEDISYEYDLQLIPQKRMQDFESKKMDLEMIASKLLREGVNLSLNKLEQMYLSYADRIGLSIKDPVIKNEVLKIFRESVENKRGREDIQISKSRMQDFESKKIDLRNLAANLINRNTKSTYEELKKLYFNKAFDLVNLNNFDVRAMAIEVFDDTIKDI